MSDSDYIDFTKYLEEKQEEERELSSEELLEKFFSNVQDYLVENNFADASITIVCSNKESGTLFCNNIDSEIDLLGLLEFAKASVLSNG